MSSALEQLKDLLGDKLCTPEQVKAPEGVATGLNELDRYLFWHGLPKGALTLFSGAIGTGATSLWVEAAARTIKAGKWVAWINHDIPLSPLPLSQKGVNLGHFVSIQPDVSAHRPTASATSSSSSPYENRSANHLFFILQELLSSALFELVGCDLGTYRLKEHQLRKLQTQARDANIALVFLSQNSNVIQFGPKRRNSPSLYQQQSSPSLYRGSAASIFSLIVRFEKRQITIERALHRQTPHRFQRSLSYARFTHFSPSFTHALSGASDGINGAISDSSNDNSGDNEQIEHARA